MIAGHVSEVHVPLTPRLPAWLSLSRRTSVSKDAEILLLRHQITLLERRGDTRAKLTWTDRALSAALLAVIPRGRHAHLRLPMMLATILRWGRNLLARRWAAKSRPKSPGRARKRRSITGLVLRMARENAHWGIGASPGARRPGHHSGAVYRLPSAVWEILKQHGVDPAPGRGTHARGLPSASGPCQC